VTLNYTTRDGTASAGEDYIATSGIVTLYSDESSVVIPVEVIGDTEYETNEVFYLDITNPSVETFDESLSTLVARRVIVDDERTISQESGNTLTYATTEYYMNEIFNITMAEASDIVLAYVSIDLQSLYNIFIENNINNDMLADILSDTLPSITSEGISTFLTLNGFEGEVLGTYYNDLYFVA